MRLTVWSCVIISNIVFGVSLGLESRDAEDKEEEMGTEDPHFPH